MTLVIMAAGMGSRFGGLKQITPFGPNGEFLLDYSVYDAIKAGFNKIVFIIKKENLELFEEVVGSHLKKHIEVEYVFQEQTDIPNYVNIPESRVKPWGTAHALYSARNVIKEDFAILNADDFYGAEAFKKIADYLKKSNEEFKACMVGYRLRNTLTDIGTVSRGICEVEDGYLVRIDERLKIKREAGIMKYFEGESAYDLDEEALASMNIWGFSSEIFRHLEDELNEFFKTNESNLEKAEFLLPTVVGILLNKGLIKVKMLDTDSRWMGVTYKEDIDGVVFKIQKLIEEKKYPEKLWD